MRAGIVFTDDLLSEGYRLDASFHASPGRHSIKQLSHSGRKLERLDQVCLPDGVFIPGRFKRIFVDDPHHGAPYLSGGSIMQADPLQGAKLLSLRYTGNMDRLALREKMILITCSGEIGNTVYVNGIFKGAVGSPDLIRVLVDPKKIRSGYLYTYLSSPQARALIQQKTYGAVIPHIEAHHVVDLPIPRLNPSQEEEIHRLIEQAAQLRENATHYKLLAQNLVAQLINVQLDGYATNNKIAQISVDNLNDRFEATYHNAQKSASALTNSSYPLTPISDLLERIFYLGKLHRVFVEDSDSGVPLLSISDVQKAKLTSNKFISRSLSRNVDDALLSRGWVLISRVGTPGLAIYTRREMEGFAGTDHLVRLVPKRSKALPGFLFSILSSLVGQKLLESSAHGSVQLVLPPEYIGQIKIPLPPIESQRDIHDLIEKYGESLTLASELEDQAQSLLSSYLETPNKPVVSQ